MVVFVCSSSQGKLEEAVEVVSEMVNRQYLRTPRSKMSEAARNVDFLCNEYLSEMKEVAANAARAVKKEKEAPPPRATPPPPAQEPHQRMLGMPPFMGIPLGEGPEIPEQPGDRRYRLIGLLNQDGTLHILRVPEDGLPTMFRPTPELDLEFESDDSN